MLWLQGKSLFGYLMIQILKNGTHWDYTYFCKITLLNRHLKLLLIWNNINTEVRVMIDNNKSKIKKFNFKNHFFECYFIYIYLNTQYINKYFFKKVEYLLWCTFYYLFFYFLCNYFTLKFFYLSDLINIR